MIRFLRKFAVFFIATLVLTFLWSALQEGTIFARSSH